MLADTDDDDDEDEDIFFVLFEFDAPEEKSTENQKNSNDWILLMKLKKRILMGTSKLLLFTHEAEDRGEEWTPSGCCNLEVCGPLQGACPRR